MSAALNAGQWVRFRFLNFIVFTERLYEKDGCLYATTDRPRFGDEPCDILVRHRDGSINANISGLEVLP